MSLYNFRYGDPKGYQEDLEDALWNDPEHAVGIDLGHSVIHFGTHESLKDMLERLMSENYDPSGHRINAASVFENKDEAILLIQNAIMARSEEVAEWMFTGWEEYGKNEKNRWGNFAFTVYMREDTGHSLNMDLEEQRCNAVRIVLKRDMDLTTFGFRLKTAYPVIDQRHPMPVERKYARKEISRLGLYDFHSDTQRAAFLVDESPDVQVLLKMDSAKDKEYIEFRAKTQDNVYYQAWLYDDRVKVREYDNRREVPARRISVDELEDRYPAMAEAIKDAVYFSRGGFSIEEETYRQRQEQENYIDFEDMEKENTMHPLEEMALEDFYGKDVGKAGYRQVLSMRDLSPEEENKWEDYYGKDIGKAGRYDDEMNLHP